MHSNHLTVIPRGHRVDASRSARKPTITMSPKLFAALLIVLAVSASAYKDSDGDGVPDYLDFCEKTPKHTPVDENGCSRLQLDWDGDGLCNPDRPKYQTGPNKGSYVPVYKNWCVGLDNCMRVPNPEQQRTHKHHPKRGDACFLGTNRESCVICCVPAWDCVLSARNQFSHIICCCDHVCRGMS